MNPNSKLIVCLYSDYNFLSLSLLENLLAKNCLVNIVTDDIKKWQEATDYIVSKNRFAFCKTNEFDNSQIYSYVIFSGGFINLNETASEYLSFTSQVDLSSQKSLVLMPLESYNQTSTVVKDFTNSAVIYLGDLLGPRIDLDSDLLIPRKLDEIVESRKITLSVGEVFYPLFVPDVTKTLIKWTMSFGPYGKTTFLLGKEISSNVFWQKNKELVGDIELQYNNKLPTRTLPRNRETQVVESDFHTSLTETYRWIKSNPKDSSGKRKKIKKLINISPESSKKTKRILLPILAVLLFPIFTLIVSFVLSFIAYKNISIGKVDSAKNLVQVARTLTVIGNGESKVLSYIPLIGKIYKETNYAGVVSENILKISEELIPLVGSTSTLLDNVLGNSVYDLTSLLVGSKTAFEKVYGDLALIEVETKLAAEKKTLLAKMVLSKIDFDKYKTLVLQGGVLVEKLPLLLGGVESKTYLVLFQNNMEIRPTGGFIGSYGLVTFDKGRLSDFTVSDVYSADGQLKGHVEPPLPIKEYLGEANWWLRDSNWDPDFPTSAKRAEWFLDKEMDQEVDGVVAVDLFVVKDLLNLTNSIFLSDYNLTITPDNFYEKVQSEVENNFFPGTHKKASFLTALSRNLLEEIRSLEISQKNKVLSKIYKNLEERHIQAFIHEESTQTALESLSWGGSVVKPDCGEGCYADTVGIVEANLGVNKSNYFVERNVDLNIDIGDSEISRTLKINLKNSANSDLGLSGKYGVYIRFLVAEDSTDFNIVSKYGQSEENLTLDISDAKGRKEVGTWTQIIGGQSKELTFSWKTKIDRPSVTSYGLYIRKQAGVEGYPININIALPEPQLKYDSRFTLTRGGTYLYNTILSQDILARFKIR